MPVVLTTAPPPPPPPPPPRPQPPQVAGPSALWIAPDGTVIQLTGQVYRTLDAVTGWGAAPVSITADPHPRGGTRVRHIQPEPRTITWPVRVWGRDHQELVAAWRELARALTQTRRLGPGRLRVTRPDGSAREIEAIYEAGLSGEPGQGHLYDTAVLSLYCPDPYWRDVTPRAIVREYAIGAPYLDPYPTVSSGRTLGDTVIDQDGDVEAWPVWTITGPLEQLIAINHTTGERFTLTYSLGAGDEIVITTDPPTVRGPGGEVLTGALDWPGATLWGLVPGENRITFTALGASAGTRIELTYVPRYETA